jgi:hypothetical protein
MLSETIKAAKRIGTIKETSMSTIVVDTTVQPKAVAHPTDNRLLNRTHEQWVDEAKTNRIELRQNYTRVGSRADFQPRDPRARGNIGGCKDSIENCGLARSSDSGHRVQDPRSTAEGVSTPTLICHAT